MHNGMSLHWEKKELFIGKWMNLKIILSKIVQTQKDKCCIFSVVCGPLLLMFHVCACIFRCVYVLAIFHMYVYLAGVRVCACICVHRYVCLHRS